METPLAPGVLPIPVAKPPVPARAAPASDLKRLIAAADRVADAISELSWEEVQQVFTMISTHMGRAQRP